MRVAPLFFSADERVNAESKEFIESRCDDLEHAVANLHIREIFRVIPRFITGTAVTPWSRLVRVDQDQRIRRLSPALRLPFASTRRWPLF